MAVSDVAVIGAGFAGIAAARALSEQGLTVRVLEARERIGGRAHTVDLAPGVAFDYGCSWLHCADINPLVKPAEEAGLSVVRETSERQFYRGSECLPAAELDDYGRARERVFSAARRAAAQGSDATLAEFVGLAGRWQPQVENVIRGIWGVDPDAYGVDEYAAEHDTDINWPVVEGLGRLVEALARGLPVETRTAVQAIDWSATPVRLATALGDVFARAVVVTVPTALVDSVDFAPALPAWKREAAAALPLGRSEKVALRFAGEPLPVPRNSFTGLVGGEHAFGFFRFPCPDTLIVSFFGGSRALWLDQAGEQAAIEWVLDRLVDTWGAAVLRQFRGGVATQWGADAWTRGGYSAARPGMSACRARLAEPLEGRVFFAGEATSEHHFATAHGAWWSGQRAAQQVAEALRGR